MSLSSHDVRRPLSAPVHTGATAKLLRIIALLAATGAATMSAVTVPTVWLMSPAYAIVFALLAAAQYITAGAVVRRPGRRSFLAAAAAAAVVLLLWASRHVLAVLPDPDPWVPLTSAIGFLDAICAALEAVALLVFGALALVPATGTADPAGLGSRIRRSAGVLGTVPLALAVLLGFVVGVVGGLPGFPASTIAPHGLPSGPKSTVEYCRPNGVPLPMDLYTPTAAGSAQRPAPVALYIHGGGFVLGNRRTVGFGGALGNHEGALFTPLRQRLTDRGFVVASIDYRLPPGTPWPAPIEDVKCAVRFLRAHAPELGIDPDRIGVWGSSAGAQLACLLGLAGPAAGFDRGQYTEQSSAVQAVVDMFGCADLEHLHDSSPVMRLSVWLTLGDSTHLRHQASPTGYDPHGAPPFLILHGSGDADVPLRHSIALLQRLHAAGVPATLIEVHGADHGLNNPHQQPPPDQITAVVVEFLHTHLS